MRPENQKVQIKTNNKVKSIIEVMLEKVFLECVSIGRDPAK